MKKFLLAIGLVAMGMQMASADELYTIKFSAENNQSCISAYDKEWVNITDGNSFTLVGFNNNGNGLKDGTPTENTSNNQTPWTWVRCGRKNNTSVATITTGFAVPEKLNSVVLSLGNNKTNEANLAHLKSCTLTTSATEDFATVLTTVTADKVEANSDLTFTLDAPAANLYYRVTFVMEASDTDKATANGFIQVNKVVYNGEPLAVQLLPANLKWSAETAEMTIGQEFEGPVLTKDTNAEVTFTSSDETVATINESGVVTALKAGVTTIKAVALANDEYKAGEASYVLTVIDPTVAVLYNGLTANLEGWDIEENLPEGLTYVWSWDEKYNCAKASAYVKQNYVAESRLVSPVIDATKNTATTLTFDQAANYFNKVEGVTVDKQCSVEVRVENGEWEALTVAPWPTNFTFVANEVDLSAYDGKKFQVSFVYTSTEAQAGTWEVKNVKVAGKVSTAVSEVETEDAPVVYYDLNGRQVKGNLEKGIYVKVQGKKATKVAVF